MSKSKAPIMQKRSQQVRLMTKHVTEDGEFEGYGSVFGNQDSYGDVVAPGAFATSLEEHAAAGTLPALLWQHDQDKPIGIYTEMREDSQGLWVKGRLILDTQLGREAHALLKAGAINGLSIGYMPKEWKYDEDEKILTLLEVDLWECSVVTFPANPDARVSGVKAHDEICKLADWKSFERHLREAGGYSHQSATGMVAVAKRIADSEREARAAIAQLYDSTKKLLNSLKS
ncbi:MAG: HK97 family phage prohead protease [Pseudomonadota bacterium]